MADSDVLGRERELSDIEDSVRVRSDRPRLLLVEGPAGIGKATLCLEALLAS